MNSPVIIIGAGMAGLTIAEALRSEGFAGQVMLIGDEERSPYQRPPLSKGLLTGENTEAQLQMRTPEALEKKNIELITGVKVTTIDRASHRVHLDDGRSLEYGGLALATGSRNRPLPLPGVELDGVISLRTFDDAKRLIEGLKDAQSMVVVGGGFIGLEVAACANKMGKDVVILEAMDRLMARAVAPLVSEFYAGVHRSHGVRVELNAKVSELVGRDGHISAVRTADGKEYPADLLLVGIGVIPNDELAKAGGLECNHGIVVDACARTLDPAIVAAGDCTARRQADGALLRLESVQNALEQGKSAAAALMGKDRPFVAVPWFWSDQYDVKLQMVGLSAGYDQIVTRGSQAEQKFTVFYFRAGKLLCVDSINQPKIYMAVRKLLDKGGSPTPEQAADESFALETLLQS